MGKVGTKRITQKRCNKSSLDNTSKPSIKRLARRGGVKRISSFVYDDSKMILKKFLEGIVRDTVIYTEHAKRKTITSFDAINALKGQERTIYGYGDGAYPSQRTRSQQK